jgi:methionine synthase I (cobalamin-dependent)
MSYEKLKRRLAAGEVAVLDGATGTELQRRGAPMDPAAWCGPATLQHHALLADIHADYIAAGADVVTANTFAASRIMLGPAGLADRSTEIATRAVEAALAGRARAGRPVVVVAGSLSHMVPVASGTDAVDPRATPGEAELSDAFHALAHDLKRAGAELILLEMMYHPGRTRLAVMAALSTGLPVWFGMSARRADDGRVVAFHHLDDLPLSAITALIPAQGVDVAGVMHTNAAVLGEALRAVREVFPGPLSAYPDSGYFEMPDWRFVDTVAPDRFEAFCDAWVAQGAQVLGGCCGLGVDHVRAAARAAARANARR